MAYIETWDETKPAGSRDANLGDDDIREGKRAIRERLAGGGMYFPSTDDADAGLYNYVKFIEQSGNPSSVANRAFLFTKDVSGVTELYWMDSAGTVIQLTSGGKILATSLFIASEAQGDILYRGASAWSRLGAGTSGQFLKTQGAAANPAWSDVAFQTAASQAEMEAATSNTVPVTPGRLNSHPGAAKGWVRFNAAGTIIASHNVTSVTDNGVGDWTVNWTVPFSSANYSAVCSGGNDGGSANNIMQLHTFAAGSLRIQGRANDSSLQDVDLITVVAYGDQ